MLVFVFGLDESARVRLLVEERDVGEGVEFGEATLLEIVFVLTVFGVIRSVSGTFLFLELIEVASGVA